jgi:hypothetical protein
MLGGSSTKSTPPNYQAQNTMMIIPPLLSCASTTEYITKRRAKRSAIIASDATHYLLSTLAFMTALLVGLPQEDVAALFLHQSYQRIKTPPNQDVEDLFGPPLTPV